MTSSDKWQPISTAPKDGSDIFGGKWLGARWTLDLTHWERDGWWQMRQVPPTHWMAIPAFMIAPPDADA